MSTRHTVYTSAQLLKVSVCLGLCGFLFSGCALETVDPDAANEAAAGDTKQELQGEVPCSLDGVSGFTCHVSGPGAEDPGGYGVNPGIGGNKACYTCRSSCTRLASAQRAACLARCDDTVC